MWWGVVLLSVFSPCFLYLTASLHRGGLVWWAGDRVEEREEGGGGEGNRCQQLQYLFYLSFV